PARGAYPGRAPVAAEVGAGLAGRRSTAVDAGDRALSPDRHPAPASSQPSAPGPATQAPAQACAENRPAAAGDGLPAQALSRWPLPVPLRQRGRTAALRAEPRTADR